MGKESEKASMTGIGAKLSETGAELAGTAQEAAETGRERLHDSWEHTSELASEYAGEMTRYANRQVRIMRDYFSDNPLMLGLAGLGIGLLAGALIPVTRAERRFLRPLGRELRETAGETMRQVRRKVDDLVAESEADQASPSARPSASRAGTGTRPPASRSRH